MGNDGKTWLHLAGSGIVSLSVAPGAGGHLKLQSDITEHRVN